MCEILQAILFGSGKTRKIGSSAVFFEGALTSETGRIPFRRVWSQTLNSVIRWAWMATLFLQRHQKNVLRSLLPLLKSISLPKEMCLEYSFCSQKILGCLYRKGVARVFSPHWVLGRELIEFLSAICLCAKANLPSFLQNSPGLPQSSVSYLFRNSTHETVPFDLRDYIQWLYSGRIEFCNHCSQNYSTKFCQ